MFKKLFTSKTLKVEPTTGLGEAHEWGPPSDERGDCACMIDADGKVDNITLHEQIEHGVDRTEIITAMRLRLADTLSADMLDRYYPLPV